MEFHFNTKATNWSQNFYQQKKVYFSLLDRPLGISIFLFGILLITVIYLSAGLYSDNFGEFYIQILAEAHGLIFDYMVFGVFVIAYNKLRDIHNVKKAIYEDLDDFRNIRTNEAIHKTIGNLKRMNRYKVTSFCLNKYFLSNAIIEDLKLTGSLLIDVDLSNSTIKQADLSNTNTSFLKLTRSKLINVNLKNCYGPSMDLSGTHMRYINAANSFLVGVDFSNAVLEDCNFEGCVLIHCNFNNCTLLKVNFENAVGLKSSDLLKCKQLHYVVFDHDVKRDLEATKADHSGLN